MRPAVGTRGLGTNQEPYADAGSKHALAWDAASYDSRFSYVSAHGVELVDLLAPAPGEHVLDLGCGTGELLEEIAKRGAHVVGVDADAGMVAAARRRLPGVEILLADGHTFVLEELVDAVFSNAALHWMTRPDEVARRVRAALRPGGRFVAELGGQHNVAAIIEALRQALEEAGLSAGWSVPWYFPSVAKQATVLENAGFRIEWVEHFPRPTSLDDCPAGVADWLRMFGGTMLAHVPAEHADEVLGRASAIACPVLFRDGTWYADYWRLRFLARKPDLA
jgi:trans-aconitate methyltransferase